MFLPPCFVVAEGMCEKNTFLFSLGVFYVCRAQMLCAGRVFLLGEGKKFSVVTKHVKKNIFV